MSDPKRSSLELLFQSNPDALVPAVAIYYAQRKAGQIPADMTYDDWISKQNEILDSIMPLQSVTLKFDPKTQPIRVQKNISIDPKQPPIWKDEDSKKSETNNT